MNVEIGAEAAQFPDKEYINGNAFAVRSIKLCCTRFEPCIFDTKYFHFEIVYYFLLRFEWSATMRTIGRYSTAVVIE
jgi:hypothetical protein